MVRDRPVAYMQFRDPRAYDLLALAALAPTLLLSHWIEGSRLGYALRALKANEQAAEAAGVPVRTPASLKDPAEHRARRSDPKR